MRHEAEATEAHAEVLVHGQCRGIIDAELEKRGDRGGLVGVCGDDDFAFSVLRFSAIDDDLRCVRPDALTAKHVEPTGAILCDAVGAFEHAALIPETRAELTGITVVDDPVGSGFPDVEGIAVQLRAGHAGLHAAGDIAIIEAITEVGILCGLHRDGRAGHGIVVSADGSKQRGIHEDGRVEEPRDGRNREVRALRGNGTGDVIEIKRGHHFADAEDDLVVEEALPVPELVEFRSIERRGPGEAIVALHAARLAVGVLTIDFLPVELEKLDAERGTFPTDHLLGIQIGPHDERAVEAPLSGLFAAGKKSVRIGEPDAPESQAGLFGQTQ